MKDDDEYPHFLRDLILSALPEDTSLHGASPKIHEMYLPDAHAKALRPDNMVVVGIRGSGKSFWWAALQQKRHRSLIGSRAGLNEETRISTGFGEDPRPDDYPGKDTLLMLLKDGRYEPRKVWLTIVLWHIGKDNLPGVFLSLKTWEERVAWVQENPEPLERSLYNADQLLINEQRYHLILFDALDRTADDWETMHKLVRGLLQVALDIRSYQRIRLKIFVRPDQIEDPAVAAFPDSSKILTQKTELIWSKIGLYGLFWQYLANDQKAGNDFRQWCANLITIKWEKQSDVWIIPEEMQRNEDNQKFIFHKMTGPWMGRDRRRGYPYTWLPNHLGDARGQVSPRSFIKALRYAAEDKSRPDYSYPLHYESIKRGVQEASRIRVGEIEEDYPWVKTLIEPLNGRSVPISIQDVNDIWKEESTLTNLEDTIKTENVRLPPVHLDRGTNGVLDDLASLGLIERISNDRINMPDVYRVGYSLRRKGGVKPIK
ncbi:hypothetical protein [Methanocalculus sp. MC3]